jgi:hypothetical protein
MLVAILTTTAATVVDKETYGGAEATRPLSHHRNSLSLPSTQPDGPPTAATRPAASFRDWPGEVQHAL